ncbi:MAG: linear amide C-N hydrolase [Muribaculaceae bacterium]|nr:linear amide C-N hydrolase [Muribaculaceae bacterium]
MKGLTKLTIAASVALIATAGLLPEQADACTRVVFKNDKGDVFTGRTLDWKADIGTNLYVLPRGIERKSYDVGKSIDWTSKYGSVVAVCYDMGVSEGMNEKGLTVNCLYLPGTKYTYEGDTRIPMSTSVWVSYVLDNFATTREAVEVLKQDLFYVDAPSMPDGSSTTLHMAISDADGYNAIIEYIDGKLQLHEGYELKVMTNAPPIEQQLAVAKYWDAVGGLNFLPGTNRSYDRFARASFYVNAIPSDADHDLALAAVMGVLNNCSVPVGISVPDQPEISSTRWRSIADQHEKIYYFMTTLNPSIIWVNLNQFDLRPGAPIMKLDLINAKHNIIGNAKNDMVKSQGFNPMYRLPENFSL